MVWKKITELEFRRDVDEEARDIARRVGGFIESVQHTDVDISDDITKKPRVTQLKFDGRDYQLHEEMYPIGHEGKRSGSAYRVTIHSQEEGDNARAVVERLMGVAYGRTVGAIE